MLISPCVLVVMWQTQITSFSAQKDQGTEDILMTTSGNTQCVLKTRKNIGLQSVLTHNLKIKGPIFSDLITKCTHQRH